jgi:hypothetical protein
MLAFDVRRGNCTRYPVRTTPFSSANSRERSMGMKSGAF